MYEFHAFKATNSQILSKFSNRSTESHLWPGFENTHTWLYFKTMVTRFNILYYIEYILLILLEDTSYYDALLQANFESLSQDVMDHLLQYTLTLNIKYIQKIINMKRLLFYFR